MSLLAYDGHTTNSVGAAGTLTLTTPGGITDPTVLFVCIFQASAATITAPTGWTFRNQAIDGSNAVYTKKWVTGDPTSYDFTTGDAAVGMLVAIGHCDTTHIFVSTNPSGEVNPDTLATDTTKIFIAPINESFVSTTRPFALVAFGIARNQSGAFSAFSGDALIGETTSGAETIVAGYTLDIPATGFAIPTSYFTGANTTPTYQAGFGQIVALDAASVVTGGWSVGSIRIG